MNGIRIIKNPDAIHAGTVEDVKLHICALNENILKNQNLTCYHAIEITDK
mgnify:CR=1 FL=1